MRIAGRGEVARGLPDWSSDDKKKLGDEFADVLLYLVRLSDVCGIDLAHATLRKLEINARKYPASQSRGKAAKYTAYVNGAEGLAAIERDVDEALQANAQQGGASTSDAKGTGAEPSRVRGPIGLRTDVLSGYCVGVFVGASLAWLVSARR